jgi:hypothetical protein
MKPLNVDVRCSLTASININVPSNLSEADLDDYTYEEASKIFKKVEALLKTIDGINIRGFRIDTTDY